MLAHPTASSNSHTHAELILPFGVDTGPVERTESRGASQYGETRLASAARATRRGATMSDELDEYEDGVERDEAEAAEIDEELALSDADQISDGSAEQDETSFDETRREYSGADEGDVDVEEMEEAGPLLDDPETTALLERAIDDPDGSDGWA